MALKIDSRDVAIMALRVRRAEAEATSDRVGEWHWLAEHLDDALQRFLREGPEIGEHAGWDAAVDSIVREIVETVVQLDDEEGE